MPRDEYYEMKDIAKQKAREADQAAADESTKMISKRESKPLSKEPMRTFEPMSEVQRFKRLEELKRQPAPTRELQTMPMRALEPKSEVLQRGKAPAAAANENRAKQAKK